MVANSTALIALVSTVIAFVWAWAWLGLGVSARRMAVRLEISGGNAAGEMSAVVWPLMPFSFPFCGSRRATLWPVRPPASPRQAPACSSRSSLLRWSVLPCAPSTWVAFPAWACPGWMASSLPTHLTRALVSASSVPARSSEGVAVRTR